MPAPRRPQAEEPSGDDKPKATQQTTTGAVDTTEWEQGFRGIEVDKTPNEAYSVAGVTSSDTAAKADNAAEEGKAPDGDKE